MQQSTSKLVVTQKQKYQVTSMGNQIKMGHLQNIQSCETSVETGNLQRYDEQTIIFGQIFMLNLTKISYPDESFSDFFLLR